MIAKLLLEIDNIHKIDGRSASLFQGVLMEKIAREYGEILHQNGWKPYSSSIISMGETLQWEICTLNKEAKAQILLPLLEENFHEIYLEKKQATLQILGKQFFEMSYDTLLKQEYFHVGTRYLTLHFRTPTAFKQQGNYVFYPDIRLIFQSIMNKYDAVAEQSSIFSEEVLEQLVKNIYITSYQLRSTKFCLEGIKIPSFIGKIRIKVNGPQMLVNLVNFLLVFGQYSGVGIKSSIGMGKILVER